MSQPTYDELARMLQAVKDDYRQYNEYAEAEIVRLRVALVEIADMTWSGDGEGAWEIVARAALNSSPGQPNAPGSAP